MKQTAIIVMLALLSQTTSGARLDSTKNHRHGGHHHRAQSLVQGSAEPPSLPAVKTENDVENMKEAEDKNWDIYNSRWQNKYLHDMEEQYKAKLQAEEYEKKLQEQRNREQEWSRQPLMPDGLQHWGDGRVYTTNDYQKIGGVNNYAQQGAEPPQCPANKDDQDVEKMKETEDRANDIAASKGVNEKFMADNANAAAAAASAEAQAKEANLRMTTPIGPDGLQRYPDGRVFSVDDYQPVKGVNNYSQMTGRSAIGRAVIQNADENDIETLGEKEQRRKDIIAAQQQQNAIKNAKKEIKEKAEKQSLHEQFQQGEIMPDGLVHSPNGKKFFPNGQEIYGVNDN